MKSFILVVLFCSFFVSCREGREKSAVEKEKSREEEAREEEKLHNEEIREQERKSDVTRVVIKSISYIKDPRTNFCFAYLWLGDTRGGPALSTVPCGDVPKNLLNISK